jgi:hypothetical protein
MGVSPTAWGGMATDAVTSPDGAASAWLSAVRMMAPAAINCRE